MSLMKSFRFSLVHLVLLCGATVAVHAQSQVFIGAKTGQDAGACTAAAPCRNVNYALTQVAAGGEINIVESGDYATALITKSVTVQAAPGVLASFSTYSGTIFLISASATDVIRLRGLLLDGQNTAYRGVSVSNAAAVQIDGLVVRGFTAQGIAFNNNNSSNSIANTTVSNCGIGIGIGAATTGTGFVPPLLQVTIENTRVERCPTGYSVAASFSGNKTVVTIRNSSALHCTSQGFNALVASGSVVLNLDNILSAHNNVGVQSQAFFTTVRVSNSTIVNNITGLSGLILSRVNNTVEGNTTNGAFSGTFVAK